MDDHDDDHALSDFLRERLPQVGLDYDTYGPYVLPLLLTERSDGANDEDIQEEWDSVMELLQASSESHSDDNDAWVTLRQDIQKAWDDHQQKLKLLEEEEKHQRAQQMEQVLAEERRMAEQAAAEAAAAQEKQQEHADESKTANDAAKQALLDRFGYDGDDAAHDDDDAPSNHQVAAAAHGAKMKEMRAQNVQTKKDEQAKTSQAKMEKARVKEERRKRAVKGERRRG